MVEVGIYLLIASAVTLLLIGVFYIPKGSSKRLPLPQEEGQGKASALGAYISHAFPSRIFLEKLKLDVKIKRKLDAAHIRLTPQAYFNIKL
ncbi:MAG: hypothetical protein NT066_05930, partial [Candidatus Omnitrophica bacterium]|nr:hypothetical protein [Candidatus Omnitrophota bacterium]